jgi:CheY-like chemotaxis protein/signal transduction histidine kinase
MILPLMAYIIIRETGVASLAVSWLISTATLTWCAAYMQSRLLVPTIGLCVFSQAVIYYDAKRQYDDLSCLVSALRSTVAENERLQEEARATELRAMIGNVAHDLKTVRLFLPPTFWCFFFIPNDDAQFLRFFSSPQPLTSILSGIEVIQDTLQKLEDDCSGRPVPARDPYTHILPHVAAVRACLKSMVGSNSFMTMCINRCLDYTKASKGVKLVPKPETVNLQEALDFPISIMRDVQTQLPITLAPVPAEICSHIITDKQWLMENLLCLLSNAVRYSQVGSVAVSVHLDRTEVVASVKSGPSPAGASLRFEVCDSGIGLTDEVMTTLFAPFKQAQRLAGGTGLGLFSLAKRVEALRGQYGVCKRPDGAPGSMFWFAIPYRPDDLSAVTAAVSRHASTDFTRETSFDNSGAGLRFPSSHQLQHQPSITDHILVADDAPSILKMTTMLLTKKGYSVDKAVNGAEALNLVIESLQDDSRAKFDAVLMDLQMPVMDGIEAIRRIRAAEKKAIADGGNRVGDLENGGKAWQYQVRPRRQLIIALSANSDSETTQEALDAGADYFMSKPFTYDTFTELMARREIP